MTDSLKEIEARHALYDGQEATLIADSVMTPDGYKAHLDRAYLLSLLKRRAASQSLTAVTTTTTMVKAAISAFSRRKVNPMTTGDDVMRESNPNWPLPSFDARDWAKAFVKTANARFGIAADESAMVGWFANALMRGYDEAMSRASKVTVDDAAVERALDEYEEGLISYWRNNPADEPTADLVANFKTRMRAALEAAFPAAPASEKE